MTAIAITTSSFGKISEEPLKLLKNYGLEIVMNPYGRKLNQDETIEVVKDCDGVIAGTEVYNNLVINNLNALKVISRVGVGIDSIDANAINERSILLYNTPYGPVLAVAELTIGLILNLLRHISRVDRDMRNGIWKKRMGNLLHKKQVGVIGLGRIGTAVAKLAESFGATIAYYDINENLEGIEYERMSLEKLFSCSDIITLHCSGLSGDKELIGIKELAMMKNNAVLINLSRGELIDEQALYDALKNEVIMGAALDVYNKEPYSGPLTELDNIVLTSHIGSYASESRVDMEILAVQNIITGLESRGII